MRRNGLIVGISMYSLSEADYVLKNLKYFDSLELNVRVVIIVNPAIFDTVGQYLDIANHSYIETLKGIPDFFTQYDEGSYRHAGNLNILLDRYSDECNFLVMADPDIVYIKQDFFAGLISKHLEGFDIIGLEWDKTIPSKWKDFPAPHFISINCNKVNPALVNMRPMLELSYGKREKAKVFKKLIQKNRRLPFSLLNGFLNFILLYFKKNLSADTGYKFRDLAKRCDYRVLLITNVVNYYNYLSLLELRKNFNVLVRNWLPEMANLFPKVSIYPSCLIEKYFDIYKATRPEEVYFAGQVVALHFRTVRVRNQQKEIAVAMNKEFVAKVSVDDLVTSHYVRDPKFTKIF